MKLLVSKYHRASLTMRFLLIIKITDSFLPLISINTLTRAKRNLIVNEEVPISPDKCDIIGFFSLPDF